MFTYFVAYITDNGAGNTSFTIDYPIESFDDIIHITELLKKKHNISSLVITNWILLKSRDSQQSEI